MFKKLFGKKEPKGPIVIDGKSYQVDYKFLHEELVHDYLEAQEQARADGDDVLDLMEKNAKLEAENSRLGNALFDIMKQETPSANATVKRIIAIAKGAVFI